MERIHRQTNYLYLFHILLILVLTVNVNLILAENQPPIFLPNGDLARISIPEDAPLGSVIYRLKGKDPEGGPLVYSISGEYFRVNKKTGDITLIKELDREIESSIQVIISLTDDGQDSEPLTISLRREIIIMDKNDNSPVFHNRPYAINVSEMTAVGSTIFSGISITDIDSGPNAEVQLSCAVDETPLACRTFSVSGEKVRDGEYVGIISLASPLDYESHSSYAITLRATDGQNQATVLIAITIQDVQDQPPQFFGAPYVFRAKENTPSGKIVGHISVQDGDTGNPRDLQLRLIDEAQNNYFRLTYIERDSFTGTFTAYVETSDNILDAEDDFIRRNLGVYELVLEAREIPQSPDDKAPTLVTRTGLAILIEDQDDNLPLFNPPQLQSVLKIPYNPSETWTFPEFQVEVEDIDIDPTNSLFTLQFEWNLETSGEIQPEDVFSFITPANENPSIQSKGVITIEVFNISALQPGATFDLYIVAFQKDHLVNKLNVPIEVAKGPKPTPLFNATIFRASVSENLKVGEILTQISAKNHEQLDGVKYSLIGVGANKFDVNEKTGEIKCAQMGCLDFEKDKTHLFLIGANTGSGVDDQAFSLFNLDVIEANDNSPKFVPENGVKNGDLEGEIKNEIKRSVKDGTINFDPPLFVRAVDPDLNDRISYTLIDRSMNESGIYIQQETGEIKLKKPLKWAETGEHKLLVTATDKTGKFSLQPIVIIVNAVKNLPPSFPYATQEVEILETLVKGAIVFRSQASDPDGQNSELKYSIESQPEPDLFIIEEKSGTIHLNGKLDYEEKQRIYPVIVRVQDEGKPSQYANSKIVVNVKDVNDENPKFLMENFVVEMSESSPPESLVFSLQAKDSDEGSSLIYNITCPCSVWDFSGAKGSSEDAKRFLKNFRVESKTGELFLQNSMEHKKSSILEFRGIVIDENASNGMLQNGSTTITIYITAAERINPIFGHPWTLGNPWINLSIPEDIEMGSTVVTLNAWDYIDDVPITEFKLLNAEEINNFELEENMLKVTAQLDYETKDEYIMAVKAVDGRGGESIANLKIKLTDNNDNSPVFSKNEYKGKVIENSEFPTPVLTVEASDRDDAENYGAIRYKLAGPQSNLFVIDELAGVVQVAPGADIDRERESEYKMLVLALDTPDGGPFQRSASASLTIQVIDKNDNDPICEFEEYMVGENAEVGQFVGNITCKDPDEAPKHIFTVRDDMQSMGLFNIEQNTGRISVGKPLNGRGRSAAYMLPILIEDGKERTMSITVPIKITNLIPNDGKPFFTNSNRTILLSEASLRGTPIILITAQDTDSFDNGEGRIIFKILKQTTPCLSQLAEKKKRKSKEKTLIEDVDFFKLDEQSGLLSLKESIDREKYECISVLISIEDLGTPPQGESEWFEVKLLDVDDNLPYLEKDERILELEINESTPIGTPVYNFTALDKDIFPNNQVSFEISGGGSDLFKITHINSQSSSLDLNTKLSELNQNKLNLLIKCYPKEKKVPVRECSSKIQIKINRDSHELSSLNSPVIENRSHEKYGQNKVSEMIIGVASGTSVGNLIGNVGMSSNNIIQSSLQMFYPNSVLKSPYNVTELIHIDSLTGDIYIWDNLQNYKDGHLRVEMVDGKRKLLRKKLKIFIAPNEQLLSAEISDFSKLDKWVRDTVQVLNSPLDSNVKRGFFQLLTFDQNTGDEGKTKICFQLLENENMMSQEKALHLLKNDDLQDLFLRYNINEATKGCPQRIRSPAKLTLNGPGGRFWVERSLVGIASVVAIASLSAILILCLLNRNRLKD